MSLSTASLWMKIALGCLGLGTILYIIGFATNTWITNTFVTSHYGLWTYHVCGTKFCGTFPIDKLFLDVHNWTDWFRAIQVLECVGFVSDIIAVLVVLLYIFITNLRRRIVLILLTSVCLVAVVCMVIGFVVFGTEMREYSWMVVGWSMGLAITGSIFIFIAGAMSVVELKS